MRQQLSTSSDVDLIMQRYHSFHDSILKSLTLKSHDQYVPDGETGEMALQVSGRFDVEIVFELESGIPEDASVKRFVSARFYDVKDFCLDLRLSDREFSTASITLLRIESATLTSADGAGFALGVERNVCIDNDHWVRRASRLFRFRWGEFEDRS